jgi:hypothetical protein
MLPCVARTYVRRRDRWTPRAAFMRYSGVNAQEDRAVKGFIDDIGGQSSPYFRDPLLTFRSFGFAGSQNKRVGFAKIMCQVSGFAWQRRDGDDGRHQRTGMTR